MELRDSKETQEIGCNRPFVASENELRMDSDGRGIETGGGEIAF